MNRRRFCKIFSLAALGSAVRVKADVARDDDRPMRRCRVTVLRRECFMDIQSRYLDDPDAGCCERFVEGQQFHVGSAGECPEGFCPMAWKCISAHVQRVLDERQPDTCGLSDPDNAVIACCNDGTRPVIFKIEPLS